MTCHNCNTELVPEAKFCPNCGAPCGAAPSQEPPVDPAPAQPTAPIAPQSVYQAPAQPTAPTNPQPAYQAPAQPYAQPQDAAPAGTHPYHQLDGFLLFVSIVYSYIAPIILAVGALALLIRFFTLGLFNFKAIAYVLLSLVQSGVGIWFSLRVGKQIKERKPIFLCTYQQMAICNVVLSFLVSLVSRGIGAGIGALIGSAVGLLLLNLYFIKSVRVRTYMGTDEYLKQSIFNKNTQAPAPADGSQYTA